MPVIAVKDCDVLSTLTFNDNSTFSAKEAACHWYALVTYNIILEMQAGTHNKTSLEDDKRMGRRGRVKIVNDAVSNNIIPPSDTSKQLTQTYLAKWHEWQEDINREDKGALSPASQSVRRAAETVAERERRAKLEAQRREEAALQREESVLRQLQRKDEELARKQKELDDYKRDQALRMDRVSSSRPSEDH
ncbi:hypothetical protein ARMGADRAFT_1075489 [Armillaria gallica]|uniref:Uncharacterized protein n=1 Tax=Armillaria gallica TaxID=47427 RepID=A0A2H3DTY2_ARMGA|nr:hypothetical protein ARMGADRAFT_1075489 [Armillaria gallica]